MANQHFGKLADVWKHLPLLEVLTVERPKIYAETHAGSASYPLTRTPEREYGVYWFLDHADMSSAIAGSAYRRLLLSLPEHEGYPERYPGSPMLAMLALGPEARYVLCDLDQESINDVRATAEALDLRGRTRVVDGDGLAAVREEVEGSQDREDWFVHIDPFDPFEASSPGGPSAVELARTLVPAGVALQYWYGYEESDQRAWAWDEIARSVESEARSLWCGDVRYPEPDRGSEIVGCGVLLANVSLESMRRCQEAGNKLDRVYRDAILPSDRRGSIDFLSLP